MIDKSSSSILLSAWIAWFVSFKIVCGSVSLSQVIMLLLESLITSLKFDAAGRYVRYQKEHLAGEP